MEQQVKFDLRQSPSAPMFADYHAQPTDACPDMRANKGESQAERTQPDSKLFGSVGAVSANAAPSSDQLGSAVSDEVQS